MSRESEHTCHARGCDVHVPPRRFMCPKHWYMLPKATRDAVWAAYRPGQERTMDPSREYLDVTTDAVNWLAEREGVRSTLGEHP